jgi:hypothetical protein
MRIFCPQFCEFGVFPALEIRPHTHFFHSIFQFALSVLSALIFPQFDTLPLVEFNVAGNPSDVEVRALIDALPPLKGSGSGSGSGADGGKHGLGRERHYAGDVQTLQIGDDDDGVDDESGGNGGDRGGADGGQNDMFHQQLLNAEASMGGRLPPIVVDGACVRGMKREEVADHSYASSSCWRFCVCISLSGVSHSHSSILCLTLQVFVRKFACPALPARYFRNVIPEVPISMCPSCCHFFHVRNLHVFRFAHIPSNRIVDVPCLKNAVSAVQCFATGGGL